jgi:hypothetical protein
MFWSALALLGSALTAAPQAQAPDQAPSSIGAPVARVEGDVVAYPGPPALRVTVPAGATYLGADRFILKALSDCEMHIFVEADANRRVRRFYWVHFESYLPSRPDDRMTYGETDRRSTRWGATIWIDAAPALMTRTPRPGSDTEHFRAIIRRAGYTMPPGMMSVRLVRLLDDPAGTGYGRRELMMIYGEDLASAGLTYEDVTTNGAPNERWAALEGPLVNRAENAFDVVER